MEKEITFVTFEADHLHHFQDVILPNIWEELITLESFEERSVIALAAMDGDTPAGAFVGRLFEGFKLQALSLWVEPEYRGRGIGGGLIRTALGTALDTVSRECLLDEEDPVVIQVCIEYALEEEDAYAFESFLEHEGFGVFERMSPACLFTSDVCLKLPVSGSALAFSSVDAELTDDLEALIDTMDAQFEPSLSFFEGDPEAPDCIALASFNPDGGFDLFTECTPECSEETFCGAVGRVMHEIEKKCPGSMVIADTEYNMFPLMWEKLARSCGSVVIHSSAVRTVLFE